MGKSLLLAAVAATSVGCVSARYQTDAEEQRLRVDELELRLHAANRAFTRLQLEEPDAAMKFLAYVTQEREKIVEERRQAALQTLEATGAYMQGQGIYMHGQAAQNREQRRAFESAAQLISPH